MKRYCTLLWILPIIWTYFTEVSSNREEECIEVGFARASYLTVEQAYQAAKEEILNVWKEEDKNGYPVYKNLSPQIKNVTRAALMLEQTSKNVIALIRKTRIGKRCPAQWLLKGLERHVTPLIQLDKDLAMSLGLVMSFRCLVGSPYPNVDGTCINEEGPDMGANGAKFLRLLPPVMEKGDFTPRSSVNDEKSLPSARLVSQLIRRHLVKPSVTSLFTELSHFIALDAFSIPESPLAEDVNCCDHPDHTDCEPIFLDEKDPLYSTIKCFDFKRSAPAQAVLGHREFLTVVSTYLDATPVYGPTNEEAFKRKEGYFGYIKSLSPVDEDSSGSRKKNKTCQFPKSFKGCFNINHEDGDFLENLRLLLILEHNLIADSLAEINPHFDDSLLYNEARRILIAEYNAIIYGEFVPLLIGKEIAEKHDLLPGSQGLGAKFISEVNPGILTSFALASYRNPSMIDEWRSEWGKTDILSPLHFESVQNDPYQDLLAMDIQRGRDHGLPNYAAWRAFCDSGSHIGSWEDLGTIFSKEIVDDLREIYQDEVNDVDMLVALLEKPEEGTFSGNIFTCIMVDQFARLKTGNRLYWEHDTSMLTHEQRDTIRTQSSAAALLCRHFGLEKVFKNPFKEASESNPEVDCDTLPKLNLTAWEDTALIEVMKQKEEEKRREEEEKRREEEEKRREEEEKRREEEEKRREEEGKRREEEEKRREEEGKKREEEGKRREEEEVKRREEEVKRREEEVKRRVEEEKRRVEEEKRRVEEEKRREEEEKRREEEKKRREEEEKRREEEEKKRKRKEELEKKNDL